MTVSKSVHLPLGQYASKQGVLACLLLSSYFLLPRSKWPYPAPTDRPPMDRPEWRFLVPITASPIRSMVYNVIGAMFCVLWWSPTLRTWWSPERLADRDARARQTLNVSRTRALVSNVVDTYVALYGGERHDSLIKRHCRSRHLCVGG
jgi:hypothetical protein